MEVGKFLQSCFEWESKARSITAFTVSIVTMFMSSLYTLPSRSFIELGKTDCSFPHLQWKQRTLSVTLYFAVEISYTIRTWEIKLHVKSLCDNKEDLYFSLGLKVLRQSHQVTHFDKQFPDT